MTAESEAIDSYGEIDGYGKKWSLDRVGEWWKHLRWRKRVFWKGERRAAKRFVQREAVAEACRDKDRAE